MIEIFVRPHMYSNCFFKRNITLLQYANEALVRRTGDRRQTCALYPVSQSMGLAEYDFNKIITVTKAIT